MQSPAYIPVTGTANDAAFGGDVTVTGNVLVGSDTELGDNGVGEIQLANAMTIPTTNPTGGGVVYASGGGVFLRDPSGAVSSMVTHNRVGCPMPGGITETANRNTVANVFTPTSGSLHIYSVFLMAGETVTNLSFCTSTTAASGPTHWWMVLLDQTYKQQAHSAGQTTTALGASTWKTLPMVTPYQATYSGVHYIGIMVVATVTQPTLISNSATFAAQFITGANVPTPLLGGTSTTGLTVPGTDNSTVYIAPTAATNTPYLYAS